jgi:hypothetical protein
MKKMILLIAANLVIASATSQAVMPPPDGGYPGENTAEGTDALFRLTTGPGNTAVGFRALARTTSGSGNTAVGDRALERNMTGVDNIAIGALALSRTTGSENIGIGESTLDNNTTGGANVAVGNFALTLSGDNNTAIGHRALGSSSASSGSNNIALGGSAGAFLESGDNNVYIGNSGGLSESNTIRLGDVGHDNTYIAGIYSVTVADGIDVLIDSDGHLGTTTSSERFNDQVQSMDKASEAIFLLRPVNFRYKKELDTTGIPRFGLVAEEVEKVNPALVTRDRQGKPYSIRHDAVNAMLLNEFIREHHRVQEQQAAITEHKATMTKLRSELNALTETIKEQADQFQKSRNQEPSNRKGRK